MMNRNGRNFKDLFPNYGCGCGSVPGCACESAGDHGGQKKVLSFMEVELQAIVRPLTGLLGTELGSCVRAASTLEY